MTAAERETLEQVASVYDESADAYAKHPTCADECRDAAAAIRAAIAEVDRLRADLTAVMGEVQRIQPEGSPPPFGLPFHAKWCVDAALAEADRLAAENADLRARAIPKRWVERAQTANAFLLVRMLDDRAREWTRIDMLAPGRCEVSRHSGTSGPLDCTTYPTLAAALEAASKEHK